MNPKFRYWKTENNVITSRLITQHVNGKGIKCQVWLSLLHEMADVKQDLLWSTICRIELYGRGVAVYNVQEEIGRIVVRLTLVAYKVSTKK